jgi:peroxiredoxin Q/BCP
MVQSGDRAPDFELPDQHGRSVRLSQLLGGVVVVYFYPKADTPGCTKQACSVRDHAHEYEALGVRVVGISPDPVAAIARFDQKHGLGFTLLADEDHAVAERYGVWVKKSMYGREYFGVQRATFIVGADGIVAHVIPKASPASHDEEVLRRLRLSSASASGAPT